MTFTSLTFLYFLAIVFIAYWALQGRLRLQNVLLCSSSCVFYGWWDYRFLSLLFISSLIDFVAGKHIDRSNSTPVRRSLLTLSMVSNLTILGFFKYFNFFADSFQKLADQFGHTLSMPELNIVLPVGISFYTFQSMSYTIDIYRKELKPTENVIDYLAFIAFFPHLVAGPINRAIDLLPQFYISRHFDYQNGVTGLRLMLIGFLRKMIVADNLGRVVEVIYGNPSAYSGGELFLGTLCFAFQIYCDFAAYSEIARGASKLFGFELTRNFEQPYLATNIRDFWRRWHTSLSTWFRDYLFIPLGGNRVGLARRLANISIVFVLSGLWHGANWTFLIWGALHAFYLVVFELFVLARKSLTPATTPQNEGKASGAAKFGKWVETVVGAAVTFVCVVVAWVFFRAADVSQAFMILGKILRGPTVRELIQCAPTPMYRFALLLIVVLLLAEALQRHGGVARVFPKLAVPLRWAVYIATIFAILALGGRDETEFIYFQF